MRYELMRKNELVTCARLAARAFESYNYFSNYIPNDDQRREFLEQLLRVEIAVSRRSAQILLAKEDGKLQAVALLCPPGYKKPSDLKYVTAGFLKLYRIANKRAVKAWLEMEDRAGAPCRRVSSSTTWYLNLLTVDTKCQGIGIGSRMLCECIIPYVADHSGKELTLFTNSEENYKFYKKNGFKEFDHTTFTHLGKTLDSWSLSLDV